MARLFIAVWPPEDVAADLMSLRRKDQRGARFVRPENWHITLRFLGDADPGAVVDSMRGVELPAATAQLGPAVDVLEERVLVVPVRGVDDLARTVRRRTRLIGQPPPKRFVGHLTLARVKPRTPMPAALGAMFSADFHVHEIALVQSRLHPDGARYETIETWATSA
jgi:2'-5' RNA ligase